MRRAFLVAGVFLLLAGLLAVWIFAGEHIVLLLDRFKSVQVSSGSFQHVAYEGNGDGGILHLDNFTVSLNEAVPGLTTPHIGTTREGQLGLSFDGRLFPFGKLDSPNSEALQNTVSPDDRTLFEVRRSMFAWSNLLDFNFMTGKSPSWKRDLYQYLVWKKLDGSQLEMLWRYEQYYYAGDGWVDGLMTHPGYTGLMRVQITPATAH